MQAVNILLNKHQTELGAQNTYSFIILLAKTLCQQGQYASAASMMNNIIPVLSSQPRTGLVGALFAYNKEIQALRNQQPIRISPVSQDIIVPCSNMMNITAVINNKPLSFVIDPCSDHTVIPIETAKELNIKVLPDTVEHTGQKVLLGIVGKMNIGDLEIHNIVAELPFTRILSWPSMVTSGTLRRMSKTELAFASSSPVTSYVNFPLPTFTSFLAANTFTSSNCFSYESVELLSSPISLMNMSL